ncbi:hypothetical protein M3P21_21270 [Ruegeria sp. 2012CJ41-6]|uniref:Uncharacterized protein n=1 Tax=Ruegeria spongiae TaxID=2942209 RepID=A0ABT0Q8B8_9RHOB|nr:hypothetical protein [Ruegeria spongiae]MCL6286050.1 hypothetical protein [Ruegeria spongiae]
MLRTAIASLFALLALFSWTSECDAFTSQAINFERLQPAMEGQSSKLVLIKGGKKPAPLKPKPNAAAKPKPQAKAKPKAATTSRTAPKPKTKPLLHSANSTAKPIVSQVRPRTSKPLSSEQIIKARASLRQLGTADLGFRQTNRGNRSTLKGHTLLGTGRQAFSQIKEPAYRRKAIGAFLGDVKAYRLERPIVVHRRWGGKAEETGSPYVGRQQYKKAGNALRYQAIHGSNSLKEKSAHVVPKGAIILVGKASDESNEKGFTSRSVGGGEQIYIVNPKLAKSLRFQLK